MKTLLRLIRIENLLLLAGMQLLVRYGFLKPQGIDLALNNFQFACLVLSTVLIAAAGYIINDVYDQDTDAVNKPKRRIIGTKLSETAAYNYYVGFNIVGVGLGFYLSQVILRPSFAVLFILVAALLFLYASQWKGMLIVGNLVVALTLAISVWIIGIFDIFPATYSENQKAMALVFSILNDYALLALMVNFLREMVKDLQDVPGDQAAGIRTLPVVWGIAKSTRLAAVLHLIPVVLVFWYINTYLMASDLIGITAYLLLFVVAPLIFTAISLWNASTPQQFRLVSNVLKAVIVMGIISLWILQYNIQYNAAT